jgi:hypothetical protein
LAVRQFPCCTAALPVHAAIDQAFRAFTTSLDQWWPPEYHIGQTDIAEAILEQREGGRWYEKDVHGSECEWGHVLEWEPLHGRRTESDACRTGAPVIERLVKAQAPVDGIEQQGGGWRTLLACFAGCAETAVDSHDAS